MYATQNLSVATSTDESPQKGIVEAPSVVKMQGNRIHHSSPKNGVIK